MHENLLYTLFFSCFLVISSFSVEPIYELYNKRPDYALCSLLSEEIRLILTASFGNTFANEYINSVPNERIKEIIKKSTEYLIKERVIRRTEEVV